MDAETKEAAREQRALANEAKTTWKTAAAKSGNPYIDKAALRIVGEQAIEATRYEDGLTILSAIKTQMDAKSSPRRIPEWARTQGATMRERARAERKIAERFIDPAVQAALRPDLVERGRVMRSHPNAHSFTHAGDGVCTTCGGPVGVHFQFAS